MTDMTTLNSTALIGNQTAVATAQADKNQLSGVKEGLSRARNMEEIEAAAQDFEAVMLSQFVGHMFEGVKSDPMFGGGPGEDMFHSIMVEEYGKIMAEAGGLGIANAVKAEMIHIQEKAQQ